MKNLLLALVLLYACGVHAQNYDVGNIAVVHGGPNIAGGLIGAAEMAAGVEFYKTHADLFDFMVAGEGERVVADLVHDRLRPERGRPGQVLRAPRLPVEELG